MKKRIVVYDDNDRFVRNYVKRLKELQIIQSFFDVTSMSNKIFEEQMEILRTRQKRLRTSKKVENESLLDEVSIFMIEYDLFSSLDSKSYFTGEDVAYLSRCFSKCELIIGINHYGDNTFDLTLRGHPESYADLNIGSEQLDNPGLWGEKWKGFRPWYWPILPNYLERVQQRVEDVRNNLDEPISKVLEIEDMSRILPRSVTGFLGSQSDNTTFSEFVSKSGNGLRRKDINPDKDMMARIAASRVSKWLERLVLPGQDVIVDAPHLVYRHPSLLLGDHSNIDIWNKTVGFGATKSLGINYRMISDFKFKKGCWLSRDAWFWRKLFDYQKIKEVSTPWKKEVTNFCFCEDSSSFQNRKDCSEFIIDSDSPYNRRFINKKRFKGVDYRPMVNLLE